MTQMMMRKKQRWWARMKVVERPDSGAEEAKNHYVQKVL
jgi:hypothetical protein